MSDLLSIDVPWQLLQRLGDLVAERTPADAQIPAEFAARREAIKKQYEDEWQRLLGGYDEQKQSVDAAYSSARGTIVAEFGARQRAAQKEYDALRYEVNAQAKSDERNEKRKRDEAHWEATTVFEATKDGPDCELKACQAHLAAVDAELESLDDDAVRLLRRRRQGGTGFQPVEQHGQDGRATAQDSREPLERLADLVARAQAQWRTLHTQTLPSLFEGGRPMGLLLLVWLAAAVPFVVMLGWQNWYWIAASAATAAVVGAVAGRWLYAVAARQTREGYLSLRQTVLEAAQASRQALAAATATAEHNRAAIAKRLEDDLKRADDRFAAAQAERVERRQTGLEQLDAKYPKLLADLAAARDDALQKAKADYARGLGAVDAQYADESSRLIDNFSAEIRICRQDFRDAWNQLSDRWLGGMTKLQDDVERLQTECARLFPPWESAEWSGWTPPQTEPPVIPLGRFEADLGKIEGGLPADQRLAPPMTAFSLPAFMSLGDGSLVLLKSSGEGRVAAVETIQALMLRLLTLTRPGKVRFTIIDPVGLGENFSAFMHLADYDEQIVSSRIWTESGHIDRRLTDLTEHMENVIQAYLRNEFRSIREYNDFAGEMAEPYRVLVIANFPVNFSEAAARRLASIVASGVRCGVYVLMSVDTKLEMPRDFHLADLEPYALELRWKSNHFEWTRPGFGFRSLIVERPPSPERFTELVRTVAVGLADADRVEVPFECIVPEPDAWWRADSRAGIDVPLGRAGAMKLQHLQLGGGTAQHVLIAGRTGSGKSTLLHALITNLALHYSPDEVELYLVDFKKGVEFKAFANFALPHARVIAIESEREFGLSVLERLDEELKRRGDLFRAAGTQDIKSFRQSRPDVRMPRVLLIVDEFQELFVEDDRTAQNASLLLDRLVRQGRAFGVHVLLGSQTLAGAYSLPRSTIGQMAVRIALQCSEADAHLILSEENTAARLLARPGEAIYNDANGLFEGNHPFQVVWLPEAKREEYLQRIKQLAVDKSAAVEPAIVFEGNAPADPSENPLLREALAVAAWDGSLRTAQAWLGAAVAIKPPTAAAFRRQSGSNLLVVGHREEEALGILATSVASLAAQVAPCNTSEPPCPAATFYVFDGTRPDAPEVGFWQELAPVLPHCVRVVRPRDAVEAIGEVAAELARRQQSGDENAPPVYLVVYNLVRFRELRKAEDEFSFSRTDEDKPPAASAQLADILREGPAMGIHTLVWCDTYNTVNRWLDRQTLRDFDLRVLFQMNAADSSSLIDSPAASRLGVHRAVLYDEEQGRLEKFRPYGIPPRPWLAEVQSHLHARLENS